MHLPKLLKGVAYRNQYNFGLPAEIQGSRWRVQGSPRIPAPPNFKPCTDRQCCTREIHPLDPQPHRHSMLVPRVCAPRVTWCSLGKYWSRDFLGTKHAAEALTCWLGMYIQTVILSRSDRLPRRWGSALSRQPIRGYTGYL